MKKKRQGALENPDIKLTATVKARELRFDEVPGTEVRFWGHPDHDSLSETKRKNLPENVQQGVTYRNAIVRLRIASELLDEKLDLWEGRKEEQE